LLGRRPASLSETAAAPAAPPVIQQQKADPPKPAEPKEEIKTAPAPVVKEKPVKEAAPAKDDEPDDTPAGPDVVKRVVPDATKKATSTIRGKVAVNVKVSVDSSGNVTDTQLDSPDASKYFANLATKAARQWKFRGGSAQDWNLRFEFRKSGTRVR